MTDVLDVPVKFSMPVENNDLRREGNKSNDKNQWQHQHHDRQHQWKK